ncbi:hypothetical protein J3R82DRAFT_1583 [Butyriboletus roseoflavus]|nr:hypothetical protein J3R82DRAFT_1583 [Butyriboletus roseoflavus]
MSFSNLVADLSDRYDQLGAIDISTKPIVLTQDALDLRSPEHQDRSRSLNNLASQGRVK